MKKQHIKLTTEDRETLESKLSKETLKAKVRKRILGLQVLDRGMSFQDAQKEVKVSAITLSNWAKKYKESGLEFLADKPRSGRPILFDGELRAKVTALACSEAPQGYARWSLRLLADRLVELEICEKISHTDVGRILKKANCNLIENGSGVLEN